MQPKGPRGSARRPLLRPRTRTGGVRAMTTLVVVAAIRLYRDGLAELFARAEGFRVAARVASPLEALPVIQETGPDIALIATDAAHGPALVRSISSCRPETRVVVIGIADNDP